jgi:hypothetical protein
VPLLLTRSRAWRPEPRIWAALDLHRIEADVGREVVAAARAMARQCKGTFGLVYSRVRPASAAAAVPALGVARAAADVGVAAGDVHVLEGDPREALTGLLRKGGVDLLVIAQARDAAQGRREASLTERLLAIDGCDVMIVPRGEGGSVGAATVGIAALGEDAPHRER